MSLFGSLFTGVSSLGAQSQAMGVISNNIANVNTTAYKRSVSKFSALVTDAGRSAGFSPGGVRADMVGTVQQQGLLQQSSSTTDIAVSGNGFFAVHGTLNGAQETFYTRDGQFAEDSRGYLQNASGYYLMGWPLDATGNLPASSTDVSSLQPVDVAFLGGLTRPTTDAEISINLDARQVSGGAPHFTRALRVFDSLGEAQDLTLEFSRTADAPARTWDLDVRDSAGNLVTTINLEFDSAGGLVTPAADANGNVIQTLPGIDWGNGSASHVIDLDITDLTMFSGDYNVISVDQNGAELGLRTGVTIDSEGFVIASFSNGANAKLYKIPVVTFANVNGLEPITGNVYRETVYSGDYNLREAGQGGAGDISESSLEASNVDLADEFSRMIITQRAYSAGTKVINTSDQMLAELMNIR